MPGPDYAADIVPRTAGSTLRIATFNCENLFDRPKAMNQETYAEGQPYIDAFRELNTLFEKPKYTEADKKRILELMRKHKLNVTRPNNPFLEFLKIRGRLL